MINKNRFIYIGIIFLCCITFAFLNKSYFMSALFIICTFASLWITKSYNFYEYIYCTLLVSAIFEYTYAIPYSSKIYAFHILLVIFTIMNIIKIFNDKRTLQRFKSKFIYFYILWFIYIIVTYVWALNKGTALKYIAIYAMMLLLLSNLIIFNDRIRNFKITFKTIGFMFVVSILIGTVELLFGKQLPVVHYYDRFSQYKLSATTLIDLHYRPIAFFYNPNNFATFISLCIPFLLYYIFTCKGKIKKILAFILSILSFSVLILTTSRFNFLSLGLILIVYALVLIREKGIKTLIYPLIFVLCFGVIYKNSRYITRHTDLTKKMTNLNKAYKSVEKGNAVRDVGKDGSENVRYTIVYDVIHGVTTEKHILGFGVGNTSEYIKYKGNTHKTYDPHGWFVEITGDFGIPFTILYIIVYIMIICSLYIRGRSRNKNRYIYYGLFTATIGFFFGSFSPSSITYFLPHWILFAISLSVLSEYKN